MKKIKNSAILYFLFCCSLHLFSQGFQTQALNWKNPTGGISGGQGFNYYTNFMSNHQVVPGNNWNYLDMNGDKRPDLVVTATITTNSTETFNINNANFWKVYLNNGSGFDSIPIYWRLPAGGVKNLYRHIKGFCYMTKELYDTDTTQSIGSEIFDTFDINGDGRPDLVITSIIDTNSTHTFIDLQNRYWKVFLNNGTGFDTLGIKWSNPIGGTVGYNYSSSQTQNGFISTSFFNSGYCAVYSQNYFLEDLNSDNKPDLIISSIIKQSGYQMYADDSYNPYWQIYYNTGAGFQNQAAKFYVPRHNYFHKNGTASLGYENGNDYHFVDINGDGKSDIVLTGKGMIDGYLNMDDPSEYFPSWKVYLNSGSGISTEGIFWKLPVGGVDYSEGDIQDVPPHPPIHFPSHKGFGSLSRYPYLLDPIIDDHLQNNGSENWTFVDFNGDKKPDLCVTSSKTAGNFKAFGTDSIPTWKIYMNTGKDFSTEAIEVTIPISKGAGNNGLIFTNYINTSYTPLGEDFFFSDINADTKPDIIVTSEFTGSYFQTFGNPTNRYWKVYTNNYIDKETSFVTEIYPNPFSDKVTISLQELITNATLTVYDLLGKKIFTQTVISNKTEIDLNGLSAGLYLFEVRSPFLNIVKKVIKTK